MLHFSRIKNLGHIYHTPESDLVAGHIRNINPFTYPHEMMIDRVGDKPSFLSGYGDSLYCSSISFTLTSRTFLFVVKSRYYGRISM